MEKVIKILESLKPGVNFAEQKNMIEDGILSSFDMIKLVMELSEEFDIEITPLYIIPENFKSAETIYQLIQKIEDEE